MTVPVGRLRCLPMKLDQTAPVSQAFAVILNLALRPMQELADRSVQMRCNGRLSPATLSPERDRRRARDMTRPNQLATWMGA